MQIRRAAMHEGPELTAIAMAAKAHWPYTPAQLEAWRPNLTIDARTINQYATCVAVVDGRIAGFYVAEPGDDTWRLAHLWIRPQAMRRGIGRALLDHACRGALDAGATALAIDADPYAEPFYRACGARPVDFIAAPIEGAPRRLRPQMHMSLAREYCRTI